MSHDDHDRRPEAPFDPGARRREIEEMERRFKERGERSGGGPVLTGDVDHRVQGEMQEFFAESEAQLEQVVPGLDEGPGGLSETTGEIREKLERFFTQVNETAPASAASAGSDLHKRQKRWAGMEPHQAEAEPERRRPFSPSSGAGGADKMDLKTALERLKRHGVVKGDASKAPPPAAPPSPAAPPPPAGVPVGPTRSELSLTHEVRLPPLGRMGAQQIALQAQVQQRAPAPQQRAPAPQQRSAPIRSAPPPPAGFSARPATRQVAPSPRLAPSPAPAPAPQQRARMSQPGPDTAPVLQPLPTAEIARPRRAAPVIPPPEPRRSTGRPFTASLDPHTGHDGGAGEFDEIFSEVEDLVIATLRESTQALQLPPAQPGETGVPPLAARAAPVPARPAAQPAAHAHPAAQVRAPAPRHAPLSQVLPPPQDDEGEEMEPEEEAPAGPHDWGVRTSSGPPGGWIMGTDIVPPTEAMNPSEIRPSPPGAPRLTANIPPRMPAESSGPSPASQEAEPAAPPSGGGGAGARQIIMKKLKQQAHDFEPVVQALRDKNILSEEDVRGEDQSGPGEDSDEVSIDSFKDRPRGEDTNLTPMQMVEEIRRLRRIQEALLRKGVLCDDDIEQTLSDD